MTNIVTTSDAVLLDLLTDEQLATMREANKANTAVTALIDARLEAKAKAIAQAKVLDEFKAKLAEFVLPEPPEGVYNVYAGYAKVFRPLTAKEAKDFKATHPEATDEEIAGKRIETDEWAWQAWVINKALAVPKAGSTATEPSTRKLAITLHKRDGQSLVTVGNFRTSKEACDHLGLATGKDSARRVLEGHHFIVDSYDGTDFLIKAT